MFQVGYEVNIFLDNLLSFLILKWNWILILFTLHCIVKNQFHKRRRDIPIINCKFSPSKTVFSICILFFNIPMFFFTVCRMPSFHFIFDMFYCTRITKHLTDNTFHISETIVKEISVSELHQKLKRRMTRQK